jgi:hypothetical protein
VSVADRKKQLQQQYGHTLKQQQQRPQPQRRKKLNTKKSKSAYQYQQQQLNPQQQTQSQPSRPRSRLSPTIQTVVEEEAEYNTSNSSGHIYNDVTQHDDSFGERLLRTTVSPSPPPLSAYSMQTTSPSVLLSSAAVVSPDHSISPISMDCSIPLVRTPSLNNTTVDLDVTLSDDGDDDEDDDLRYTPSSCGTNTALSLDIQQQSDVFSGEKDSTTENVFVGDVVDDVSEVNGPATMQESSLEHSEEDIFFEEDDLDDSNYFR